MRISFTFLKCVSLLIDSLIRDVHDDDLSLHSWENTLSHTSLKRRLQWYVLIAWS